MTQSHNKSAISHEMSSSDWRKIISSIKEQIQNPTMPEINPLDEFLPYLNRKKDWDKYKDIVYLQIEKAKLLVDPTNKDLLDKKINELLELDGKIKQIDAAIYNQMLVIMGKQAHHEHKHHKEELMHAGAELKLEAWGSAAEVLHSAHEFHEAADDTADIIEAASHSTESVSTGSKFLQSLPFINNFVYGLNCLYQAYEAINDKDTSQRKTKIAAGIFGGLVSIGSGIVGSLLLAGAGLLGTAAAISIAPIVLGAAALGVYAVSLYRDVYSVVQESRKLEHAQSELIEIENKLNDKRQDYNEARIECIRDHQVLLGLQKKIDHLHKDKDKVELLPLLKARAAILDNNPDLKLKLLKLEQEKMMHDPEVTELRIQRVKAKEKIKALATSVEEHKKSTRTSVICMIGVGIAFGALFATGIGALVLTVSAVAIVGSTSIKRVLDIYAEKRAAAKEAKRYSSHASQAAMYDHANANQHSKRSSLGIGKALAQDLGVGQFLNASRPTVTGDESLTQTVDSTSDPVVVHSGLSLDGDLSESDQHAREPDSLSPSTRSSHKGY